VTKLILILVKIERPASQGEPDNTGEFINPDEINQSGFFTYLNTDLNGVFKVYSDNRLTDEFSVNHDPLESVVKYISNKEFEEYLSAINFKGTHFQINKDENLVEMILQARFGSELWKIFILAAIITTLIEMLVARNVKKEMMQV